MAESANTSLVEVADHQPDLCYLLSSCSRWGLAEVMDLPRRIVEEKSCTLGRHNFLDVNFFTPDMAACRDQCEAMEQCRCICNHSSFFLHYAQSI